MPKVLTPIDLAQNELQNARIQNLAAAPSSPVPGQVYFNSGNKNFYGWDGTQWVYMGQLTNFTPVQNGGNVPKMQAGADGSKPTASGTGLIYIATDTGKIYRDAAANTWSQLQNDLGQSVKVTTGQSAPGSPLSGDYWFKVV